MHALITYMGAFSERYCTWQFSTYISACEADACGETFTLLLNLI